MMTREKTMKEKYGKDVFEKWGGKGGKAKVKKGTAVLTKEQRVARATEAANKRWEAIRKATETA